MVDAGKWALSQKLTEESVDELVKRLNSFITAPNPVPAPLIASELNLLAIRDLVTDEEAFKVLNTNVWTLIAEAVECGDLKSISGHIRALVAGGTISPASAKKVSTAMAKSATPDPNWPSTVLVTPADLAGYSYVTLEQVLAAIEQENPVEVPVPQEEAAPENVQSQD